MGITMCANNRINRTGWQAQRATDASLFIYPRKDADFGLTKLGIDLRSLRAKQLGEPTYRVVSTGRTLINICRTINNGISIGAATWITTLCTLCLRQQIVNLPGEGSIAIPRRPGEHHQPAAQRRSQRRHACDGCHQAHNAAST
jgi:hypothetical protein